MTVDLPRFRFFALNTEMRWRALQSGRIYIHQHAQLTVDEREGDVFCNRVLRGTRRTHVTSTLWSTPLHYQLSSSHTVQLISAQKNLTLAVNDNPALADWFFCHRIQKFVEVFYLGVLNATDYWMTETRADLAKHTTASRPLASSGDALQQWLQCEQLAIMLYSTTDCWIDEEHWQKVSDPDLEHWLVLSLPA